jgi:hypothetical protein
VPACYPEHDQETVSPMSNFFYRYSRYSQAPNSAIQTLGWFPASLARYSAPKRASVTYHSTTWTSPLYHTSRSTIPRWRPRYCIHHDTEITSATQYCGFVVCSWPAPHNCERISLLQPRAHLPSTDEKESIDSLAVGRWQKESALWHCP